MKISVPINLDQATRDRCAAAVLQLRGRPDLDPADTAKDAWNLCCADAVKAIRALPAAPVQLPTLEEVAKHLCCKLHGCDFEKGNGPLSECRVTNYDRNVAGGLIILFTGDTK